MKKLLILSGKGGTGKTTTAAAFIRFSAAEAFADCDVDAPNLHLVTETAVDPLVLPYYGSEKAVIDPAKCTGCGKCAAACRFEAIRRGKDTCTVDAFACEGCGVCELVCPQKAVSLQEDVAGELALYLDVPVFSTAKLRMGRGNSGKLVSEVKQLMVQGAPDARLAVIDGSPGIGCPVISSVSGVDLVLIVTEPSASGLSDLTRLLHTAETLQVPAAVCVNRWDVCPEKADEIEACCRENAVPFVGKIPFDRRAGEAINAGKSIADTDCPMRDALRQVYAETMELLHRED